MPVITKEGFVATAQAIAATDMPDDVRISLVESLVGIYETLNEGFDPDKFRFLCRVFTCKYCGHKTAGQMHKHYQHVHDKHDNSLQVQPEER